MADFQTVIKNHARMCTAEYCNECKMREAKALHKREKGSCVDFMNEFPEEYEAVVLKWAEEHPLMTWERKLKSVLPDVDIEKIIRGACPGFFFKGAPGKYPAEKQCVKDEDDWCDCGACWEREATDSEARGCEA